MISDDDEAFTWAGDKPDRVGARPRLTNSKSPKRNRTQVAAESDIRPEKRAQSGTVVTSESITEPKTLSNWEFVLYGVFAGIYLLFTIAWLITLLRNPLQFADALGNVMFVEGLILAVCAPTLWFAGVLTLGRSWSAWLRFGWLVLGVVVLIPWPYIGWVQ